MAPKSARTLDYEVKNFSALSGSTYQVYAVIESEDGEMHYTSVAPGTVKIITSEGIMGLNKTVIVILLLILIVVFVGAQ